MGEVIIIREESNIKIPISELLLVCRISSTLKLSKKTKNALQEVLHKAVELFDFNHAAFILVVNGKIFARLQVVCSKIEGYCKTKALQYRYLLEDIDENGDRISSLSSLRPAACTTIPVILRARDPVGTMEIAVFNAPAANAQNLLDKGIPLGRHIANIIQDSVFFRQKDRTFRKLSVWLETVSTINSSLNLNQVLHIVAQLTADLFNARCAIFLYNETDKSFVPAVAVGSYDQELKRKFKAQKGMPPFPAFLKLLKEQQPVILTPENVDTGLPREIIDAFSYAWMALLPLVSKSGMLGVMQVDRPIEADAFNQEDIAIISALVRETSIAMENTRLLETLAQKEKILQQLLRKSISSQEDERKRVASEIHDGSIQAMLGIWYRLQNFTNTSLSMEEIKHEMAKIKDLMEQQISDIRKIVYNLRPVVLDTYGLGPAIRMLLNTLQEESKISFELALEGPNQRLPSDFELTLYRIMQELLANVLKHSQATKAQVILINGQEKTILVIKDNGVGFDVSRPARDRKYGNLGLASIQERILLLGGTCKVESRLGWGTTVTISVNTPPAT